MRRVWRAFLFEGTFLAEERREMMKLFTTEHHAVGQFDEPAYIIRDGKLFRTVFHPAGWSDAPEYELLEDGKIYRTGHHKLGASAQPDYVIGSDLGVYRSVGHPDSEAPRMPDFVLMDN